MSVIKFEDFMKLTNFFYNSVGIQPYDRRDSVRYNSLLSYFIFYGGLCNTSIWFMAEWAFALIALTHGNMVEGTMTLSYIGFVLVGEFKMVIVWYKRRVLTQFMRDLEDIFPYTPKQQANYNLKQYLDKSKWITQAFALMYMVLIWTYNLFVLMQYFIYEKWLQVRSVELTLPYYVYIPWEWKNNWTFYVLYAAQNVAGYQTAAGQIASDLLLCATATQVIMHYDCIARIFAEYRADDTIVQCCNSNENETKRDMEFLKNIIAYHQKVLNLSEAMNNVFGITLFINFISSSFIICFVGFQMTLGIAPDTMFKLFLFFVCSATQVYLICYYGQMLMDASTQISAAVYNHNWFNVNQRYKKMLILLIARSQKPALLKATHFLNITLNTMTSLMQVSYKFFALLRTMYSQ